MYTLTPAQERIVDGIRTYWDENHIPPTVRDVRDQVGLASTATVQYHLDNLEDLGVIERTPGAMRSIRLAQPHTGGIQ